MTGEGEKLKLLDSDEEEEIDDDLRVRPLYEGPHGQRMLEINSQIPKRFKLDERFAEDFEPEDGGKKMDFEDLSEENKEKMKNIRILETVLGHAINTKPSDKNIRKQLIRFDPDDENASRFVKTPEITNEKPKKSKKKKETVEKKIEDPVPVSTERYIEVCSDLKEILSSSTPFSFSQHFNFDSQEAALNSQNEICPKIIEVEVQDVEKKQPSNLVTQTREPRVYSYTPKSKWNGFFIVEGDPRLKEGIAFFKRPKSLEEIRTEWQKRREHVLELFRRKRRSSQRSYSTRVQNVQMKNNIRKNNFKN